MKACTEINNRRCTKITVDIPWVNPKREKTPAKLLLCYSLIKLTVHSQLFHFENTRGLKP